MTHRSKSSPLTIFVNKVLLEHSLDLSLFFFVFVFVFLHIACCCNGLPLQYSCLENPMDGGAWWAAVHRVARSQTRLCDFIFTFHFHALEKEMATHSSVLAWRIQGSGEPGGLPSLGSHRVGHDWSDLAAAAALASEWQSCDEGHVALTTKTLTHHLAFYEISVFPSALDVIFSLDLGPAPLPNSVRTLLTRKKGRK